jgi:hypothetical protein
MQLEDSQRSLQSVEQVHHFAGIVPPTARRLILGAIARALREQRLCQPQGCFGSADRASSLRVSHGASTLPERTFRSLDLWSFCGPSEATGGQTASYDLASSRACEPAPLPARQRSRFGAPSLHPDVAGRSSRRGSLPSSSGLLAAATLVPARACPGCPDLSGLGMACSSEMPPSVPGRVLSSHRDRIRAQRDASRRECC